MRIIELIKSKIKEHEENNYCTNYDHAQDMLEKDVSEAFDNAYDCGRYEVLEEILRDLNETISIDDFNFEICENQKIYNVYSHKLNEDNDMFLLKIYSGNDLVYNTWIDSAGGIITGNTFLDLFKSNERYILNFIIEKFVSIVKPTCKYEITIDE